MKRRVAVIVAVCVTAMLAGGALVYAFQRQKQLSEAALSEQQDVINRHMKTVMVAAKTLRAGSILRVEDYTLQTIISETDRELFAGESTQGYTLLVDIPKGMPICYNTLADLRTAAEGEREVWYECIDITPNISENDFCDLRIVYPNGEVYIVAAKKKIVSLDKNACALWMTSEEIARMESAIVDCVLYSGSKLIMTRYMRPKLQQPSVVTYTPSQDCIELIMNDPNIKELSSQYLSVQARLAFEQRAGKLELPMEANGDQQRNDDPYGYYGYR
jgi:hypothetical protein